ncbi:MAG: UPF0146 family protein [Methanobacteriaceae archaeon]|nr:UPF0146 family protein [Methanobacteriaceae archaeon]
MVNSWNSFSEYIIKNYKDANKIIEIAVGNYTKTAEDIEKKIKGNILLTDIKFTNNNIIDDITNPKIELYENADLLYSIRPPEELQPYMVKLSDKIDTDLIIKPYSSEFLNITIRNKFKLINYKKTSFYLKKGGK